MKEEVSLRWLKKAENDLFTMVKSIVAQTPK
jgi:hypothetical protein